MSDLKFFCPECGQKIVCDAQLIGSSIACPTCQKPLTVSSALSLPPAPSAAAPAGAGVATSAAPASIAFPPPLIPIAPPAGPPPMRTISPPLASRAEPVVAKAPPIVEVNHYSGLAIASLICSVFIPLGFIPGLICGHMAKARMQKDVFLEGEKMANAGLIISYCMLAAWLLCGIVAFGARWYNHPARTVLASGDTPFGADYRIVDQLTVDKTDDDHAEDDHGLEQRNSQKTPTGDLEGRRASRGGSFAYTLKVLPDQPMTLSCRYWGSESKGRLFDIAVDDQIIATQKLDHNVPEKFFDEEYKIPAALTRGKTEVTVEFRARPNLTAGTLYGCAVLKQ